MIALANHYPWDDFAATHNLLCRELENAGIALALLREVLEAAREVERVPLGMPTTELRVAQDNYARSFNCLANKMKKAGLSPTLLRNVVEAARGVWVLTD